MAALWNTAVQTIIFLPCGFFFFSSPNLRCLPYFYTWCGLIANLECRSEMCCTHIAGNTECKNDAKNRHLGTIAQFCWALSSQLRHVGLSTIGKNCYTAIPPPHVFVMVNFGPLTAEIVSLVWGTPANLNGFRVLAALVPGILVVGVSRLCGVEQRAPPIFSRAAIALGIGPHSSYYY